MCQIPQSLSENDCFYDYFELLNTQEKGLKLKWNDPDNIIICNVLYKHFNLKNCEKNMYGKKIKRVL